MVRARKGTLQRGCAHRLTPLRTLDGCCRMWDFTAQHTFVQVQQRWFNNTGGSRVVKHGPRINPQNFTCSCNRHTHEPRPRDSRRSASVAKPHTVLYVSRLICRRCCGSEVAKLVLTIHDHIDGCQDAGYTHKHVLSLRGGAPHSPLCSAAWQARVTYYEAQAAIMLSGRSLAMPTSETRTWPPSWSAPAEVNSRSQSEEEHT